MHQQHSPVRSVPIERQHLSISKTDLEKPCDFSFIYDQGTRALFFDNDATGASAQVQFARLSNFSASSASDIFVA